MATYTKFAKPGMVVQEIGGQRRKGIVLWTRDSCHYVIASGGYGRGDGQCEYRVVWESGKTDYVQTTLVRELGYSKFEAKK